MEYLQVIRERNFAKLWVAQILAVVSTNLLNFALIIVVFDLAAGTRFANFAVSLLVLSFAIPSILFAPAAGTYVDYWERRWVMVITNLLRTLLIPLYLVFENNLVMIIVLTVIISIITQFFIPAEAATIPKLVPRKLLLVGNSLFVFSLYAAFIVGYSASGPSVTLFGEDGPFWVTTVMMLIATILVFLLPKQPRIMQEKQLPKLFIWSHLQENWRVIRANSSRYFAVLQLAITQAMIFILVTLAPALSQAVLHVPLKQASHVLIIPVGIGMVLGVGLVHIASKERDRELLIRIAMGVGAIALTLLGLSGQLYRLTSVKLTTISSEVALLVACLVLILGVVSAMVTALGQTVLQENTPDEDRGKVFGSLNMLINIAAAAPIFVVGLLADLLSVTKVIVILGALLTIYAARMIWRYEVSKPS